MTPSSQSNPGVPATELRAHVRGEVRFDSGSRALYTTDASNYRQVLLPAVRGAGREALIIADGFSCREQIEQTTGRRTLHLAEVLQLAN